MDLEVGDVGLRYWPGLRILSEDEVKALLVRVGGRNKGSLVEVW